MQNEAGPSRRAGRVSAAVSLALALPFTLWAAQQLRADRAVAAADWARAVELAPSGPSSWWYLAQNTADVASAGRDVRRAIALAPSDDRFWRTASELDLSAGKTRAAQAIMARAIAFAPDFADYWQSANMAIALGNAPEFWRCAARALAMSPMNDANQVVGEIFKFAGNRAAQVEEITREALADSPDTERRVWILCPVVGSFRYRQQWAAAEWSWALLADNAKSAAERRRSRPVGWQLLDQLVARGRYGPAEAVWDQGRRAGIFAAYDGPRPGDRVTNGSFEHPWEGTFAWEACQHCRLNLSAVEAEAGVAAGQPGVELQYNDPRSDHSVLLRQSLLLAPDTTFRLTAMARRDDGFPETGLSLQVTGGSTIFGALPLPANAATAHLTTVFTTAPTDAAYELQVVYNRPAGEAPFHGEQWLSAVSLRPLRYGGRAAGKP